MEFSGYKTKVSAVVAGLALAGGIALGGAPQAAYAAETDTATATPNEIQQLVDTQQAEQKQEAVVYSASGTYEPSATNFVEGSESDFPVEDSSQEGTDGETVADPTTDSANADATDTSNTAPADPDTSTPTDQEQEAVADKSDDTVDADFSNGVKDGVSTQEEEVTYKDQWEKSGDKYYYWNSEGQKVVSGWVVTAKHYDGTSAGLQRYWLDADGSLLFSNLFSFTENETTYWGYATKYGYVVRGKYTTDDGLIYLADNDGKLENTGWLVTSAYGDGLQRYYIDEIEHAAVEGFSEDGYAHYTTSQGYVLRGGMAYDGSYIYADNDGKLQKSGWLVTSAFGQGLQRYFMRDYKFAKGYVSAEETGDYATYGTDEGYVLRGGMSFDNDSSRIYADNDGKLYQNQWLVTSAYGQGLQRYWVGDDYKLAKSQLISKEETGQYATYATDNYYVLRGFMAKEDSYIYANNDGRLYSGEWLVTSELGQGLQRYWVNSEGLLAKSEYISATEAGYAAYATDNYYVLRGTLAKTVDGESRIYLADNNGKLARSGETTNDWLVSSAYNQGLQRYYVYGHSDTDGGYVKVGYSQDGYAHYTSTDAYVVRGVYTVGPKIYLADNDGLLAAVKREDLTQSGWLVTSAYNQGLQRYYVYGHTGTDGGYVRVGYSADGYAHYTTAEAYVARGIYSAGDKLYLADNDGKLVRTGKSSNDWLVSSAYGQGLQRYYVYGHTGTDGGYVKVGYSTDGYAHYTLSEGYVLRGKLLVSSQMVLANNDGKVESAGWLTTSYYDGASHKYYIAVIDGQNGLTGAKTGLFTVDGNKYYGLADTGYVVTGVYVISNYYTHPSGFDGGTSHTDTILVANSDGVLQGRSYVSNLLLKSAYSQLGASYTYDDSAYYPYRAFNCSGFSWWVYYNALGINISHNQGYYSYYAQQNNTTDSQVYGIMKRGGWKTNVADLVPGDLVFFSPIGSRYHTGHVGVYIGNGKMIDSYPGPGVSVRSVWQSGFVGGGFPITLIS